jgi:hypothetical protein
VSVINVASRPRTWVGITVALAAAAAYALANISASLAYHGGSNPPTVAAIRFLVPGRRLSFGCAQPEFHSFCQSARRLLPFRSVS